VCAKATTLIALLSVAEKKLTGLRFLQAGALSPTKLRMKIMGAHNRVRVITSNSSSRTSPAKNIEASQAQNRLLVCDVLEEGTEYRRIDHLFVTLFFLAKSINTSFLFCNSFRQLRWHQTPFSN